MGVLHNSKMYFIDEASFERFFKTNHHLACLVALRYLRNEQVAEDIVQETFFMLWQRREELVIQTNLSNYLLRMVRNRSLNYLRDEKKVVELSVDVVAAQFAEDQMDDFSQEEMAIIISQSISELPPQCQRIFKLTYIDHLTYEEVASAMNLSKNTVKTQMGIAYKILRNKLSKYFLNLFALISSPNKRS